MEEPTLLELLFGTLLSIGIPVICIWAGVKLAIAQGRPGIHGALCVIICGPLGLVILAMLPKHAQQQIETLAGLRAGQSSHEPIVELEGTSATDDDLKHVAANAEIEELRLGDTRITDAGLPYLSGLKVLQVLDLSLTDISDDGIESLIHLPSLKRLWLGGTRITDAGLVRLARISTLEEINVVNTVVTSAAVNKLKATMPRCQVIF